MEEDDDVPQLSAHALSALQEFMREQGDQQADEAEQTHGDDDLTLVLEDWRMSQFWYDDATSACVAAEVNHLASCRPSFHVACIACPTLFIELKKRYPGISSQLYEYDRRFEKYGSNFTFYDYNLPLDVPHEHEKGFQLVVADPPYLSKECLEKTVETMRRLAADSEATPTSLMVLTGAVQETRVWELLKGRPCVFRPVHRNKLGNEFRLFTTYDPVDRLGAGKVPELTCKNKMKVFNDFTLTSGNTSHSCGAVDVYTKILGLQIIYLSRIWFSGTLLICSYCFPCFPCGHCNMVEQHVSVYRIFISHATSRLYQFDLQCCRCIVRLGKTQLQICAAFLHRSFNSYRCKGNLIDPSHVQLQVGNMYFQTYDGQFFTKWSSEASPRHSDDSKSGPNIHFAGSVWY